MHRLKRPSSTVVEHRSTKSRKARASGRTPVYSTRDIPWSEQLQLPEKFHRDGEGVWPALKIRRERGIGARKQYLVEWESHPVTGEVFKPSWEPAENIGEGLEDEWAQEHAQEQEDQDGTSVSDRASSSSVSVRASTRKTSRPIPGARRLRNRRVVPDPSGHASDEGSISRTPTLSGSPGSTGSALSPIEVSETQQQPTDRHAFRIDVPTPPSNKADYQSIRGSQFSSAVPNATQTTTVGVLTDTSQSFRPSSHVRQSQTISQNSSPHNTSSVRSLRSNQSTDLRSLPAPQRVLKYHSEVEVLESAQNSHNSSTVSRQSQNQAPVVHESSLTSIHNSHTGPVSVFDQQESLEAPDLARVTEPPPHQTRSSQFDSPPWVFQSQIPFVFGSPTSQTASPSSRTLPPQEIRPVGQQASASTLSKATQDTSPQGSMAARTRQSPRLQAVSPVTGTSPRVPVRTNSNRSRVVTMAPEVSSPLATALPEFPDDDSVIAKDFTHSPTTARGYGLSFPENMDLSSIPPTTIPPGDMHINPSSISNTVPSHDDISDVNFSSIPMPIQQSIEEEPMSSNEDMSLESKASSSQGSLKDELPIPQVDGIVLPTYPILGEEEYCVALPAEGKVQAIYQQTLKVKRRSILRFIHRRGSVNTAGTSATKTVERNNMIELIQRLHDTTTHIDLGLPGIPTQYTIPSQEHAAYAEYAGSKFMLLGFLVDDLRRRDCTIAILASPGATHDLLEEYMHMKQVYARRHGDGRSASQQSQYQSQSVKVELLSTKASTMVDLESRPLMIIAFDASFVSTNAQLRHTRAQFDNPIPVVHFMVTNSSEHVERCLPVSMPSPMRLRTLVRAVYQAQEGLGGTPSYIPESDENIHHGRGMDLAELNRIIRKSPKRKLERVAAALVAIASSDNFAASWTFPPMPPLQYSELEDTPPSSKESMAASNTPNTRRTRSQTPLSRPGTQRRLRSRTPLSRLGTPNARKRQSESESASNYTKRQRMTPALEIPRGEFGTDRSRIQELERELEAMRVEFASEKQARIAAEEALTISKQKQEEWRSSLASLQRRYEKRMKKSHEIQKEKDLLTHAVENSKTRTERLNGENALLRQQLSQACAEVTAAREDLKAAGGDTAILELAREETRNASSRALILEKSLENIKRDFEFTRSQYQDASSRAVEFALKMKDMESDMATLKLKASDEARKLKAMNHAASLSMHLKRIEQLELEKRTREILLKRQDEEIKGLKRSGRTGVQTRGSSAQPTGVGVGSLVGLGPGGTGTGSPASRSRQASPALGHGNVPPGSRASALRHER